jgi:hypothetical protein
VKSPGATMALKPADSQQEATATKGWAGSGLASQLEIRKP